VREAGQLCLAFLRRDFAIATSYKFQFVFNATAGLFVVAAFFFISRLVEGAGSNATLARYGGDYFSFVLIGISVASILQTGLTSFSESLRTGMTEGSLEIAFVSPVRGSLLLVLSCPWAFFFETCKTGVLIGAGVLVGGADFSRANVAACLVVGALTLTACSAFGICAAAVILVVKRGDPINWAFAQASSVLGGAYFPVDVLPPWLRAIAACLPMTHAFEGLRRAGLEGAGIADLGREIALLAGFSVVALPLAMWAVERAIDRAKSEGSLGSF
jgi:ABC-2 type transport system permease protein